MNLIEATTQALFDAKKDNFKLFNRVLEFLRFHGGYNYEQSQKHFENYGLDAETYEDYCYACDKLSEQGEL